METGVLLFRTQRVESVKPPNTPKLGVPLVARWLATHPSRVSEHVRVLHKQILEHCPELHATRCRPDQDPSCWPWP